MSMVFGVLGSGFGLYGYLPAIILAGATQVVVLKRYEEFIHSRPELSQYLKFLDYVDTENECIARSNVLVIARRPKDQYEIINDLIDREWPLLNSVILEKPIAETPCQAMKVLDALDSLAVTYRVGYSFAYLDWGESIRSCYTKFDSSDLAGTIVWKFNAHHYLHNKDSWKGRVGSGGGALRFYAIQVLGLLAFCADWDVLSCVGDSITSDTARRVSVELLSHKGSKFKVLCDSNWTEEPVFSADMYYKNKAIYQFDGGDPFTFPEGYSGSKEDRRVPTLSKILTSLEESDSDWQVVVKKSISIWSKCESHLKV